jgi:hypothetical protein
VERAFPRRALSASLIVAIAFVAVWGGRAMLYCPAMERTVSHCCCPPEDAPSVDGPVISRAACCEPRVFEAAAPPAADARFASSTFAAPLLATAREPAAVPRGALALSPPRGTPACRALAPPKTAIHVRNCVHLL